MKFLSCAGRRLSIAHSSSQQVFMFATQNLLLPSSFSVCCGSPHAYRLVHGLSCGWVLQVPFSYVFWEGSLKRQTWREFFEPGCGFVFDQRNCFGNVWGMQKNGSFAGACASKTTIHSTDGINSLVGWELWHRMRSFVFCYYYRCDCTFLLLLLLVLPRRLKSLLLFPSYQHFAC